MRLLIVVISILFILTAFNLASNSNIYYNANKSHHTYDGFTNPYIDKDKQEKNFSDLFKMMREPRPDVSQVKETKRIDLNELESRIKKQQNFYLWIGHSTVLLHVNGKMILTDPIFSDRCSPVQFAGPKRYTNPAISIKDLPAIDIVVISHNHYDHLDYNTVKKIGNSTTWFVPLGLKRWFNDMGVENVIEMDWLDSYTLDGVNINCLPSQHWSKRTLFNSYESLWASWSIEIDDFKFWFAGDTGYNDIQFKEIGDNYGPFNLASIPIGAYEPRWFMKNFHINPDEAVKIHLDVKSQKSIGIHFGTFVLTTEDIREPMKKIKTARDYYGLNQKQFLIPELGEFINL